MESSTSTSAFCWWRPPSADCDAGPTVPSGIALQRLHGDRSTDTGDEARPARSLRGLQSPSICPAVHVVTDFCADVVATDAILNTEGLYTGWAKKVSLHVVYT